MFQDKNINLGNRLLKRFGLLLICISILFAYNSAPASTAFAEETASSAGTGELHAFYPAYAVYSEQIQRYIDDVDSVSFAWSRIDAVDPGVLNTVKGKNGNKGFYYPADYLQPVTYAKNMGKSIQLNVYMSGSDCIKLLPYSDERELMAKAIMDTLQQDITQGQEIYYDGVVIDFEGLRDTDGNKKPIQYEGYPISTYFTQFLTELKEQLNPLGKKLYVAVNPKLYFDGYDYDNILKVADRVILMAHDYEPAGKLSKKEILQYTDFNSLHPASSMAPLPMVRKALNDMKAAVSDSSELSKVWLQLCFDSAQWKYAVNGPEGFDALEGSALSKAGRVTPLYQSIKDRIDNADGIAQKLSSGYNNELQTPYIQYYNTSDKTWNIILYEDSRSLTAKIDLAKAYGLGGISIWSLSNVPDFEDAGGLNLNGWASILKDMDCFNTLPAGDEQTVSFADETVEQAVSEKLGKPAGSITKFDLNGIYRLKLPEGVETLEDLKQLPNLEYLDAGQLKISDIQPIKDLKNLRVLYLQRNEITDISPLKKLTHLEILSLNGNRIVSVAALQTLKNLRELYLRENNIHDITALSKLTKLNRLEIGSNKIKNLNAVGSLKKLRQLSVDNNEITNLKGLRNLAGLTALDLSNNKISDIRYLKNLTGLTKLYLQRNSIGSAEALSGLIKLEELSLNGNRISGLKPVAKLISLKKLYLTDNKITDITPLKTLNKLQELYLSGNRISDYSPVEEVYSQLQSNCDFTLE